MKLVLASALVIACGVAHAAPLPYVLYSYPLPTQYGWSGSARSPDVEGRRVAYAWQESYCTPDYSECYMDTSIDLYDGVATRTLENMDNVFMQFVELSSRLAVWEVPNDGYQQFLHRLSPNAQIDTVTDRALFDQWSTDGNDIAWQILDGVTYRWDVVLNGRNLTARLKSTAHTNPEVENGNVLFWGEGRFMLYEGRADKMRELPMFADDQLVSGVRFGPDGDRAVWLLRDYFLDATTHHELKYYDLRTRITKSWPIDSPVEDIGFDGRYYVWHRGSVGLEAVVTDVLTGQTTVIEDALLDGTADYRFGEVSNGKLSFSQGDGEVKLYDLATGEVTDVGIGDFPFWIASWGDNVMWLSYEGAYNARVSIAFPADQAVIAISEVIDTYAYVSASVTNKLQDKLDAALERLGIGNVRQAKALLQAFNGLVNQSRQSLGDTRADELVAAANRVIGVLY